MTSGGPLFIQHQLQQVEIEPPAEFAADFFERTDLDKAEALVEMAAGVASFGDASQKRVESVTRSL